ncbi:hypothetical protein GW17_00016740 [Ensete ventricosum]|nr:hypothetical protein GW17_00016740 [Ensete ventricosum]
MKAWLLSELRDIGNNHLEHLGHGLNLVALPRLAYVHRRKSAHRDIKPSSLLIDFGRRVKIADFKVSRILAQTMDPCDSSVGTIDTDLNHRAYDDYTDNIWSFGLSNLGVLARHLPIWRERRSACQLSILHVCHLLRRSAAHRLWCV